MENTLSFLPQLFKLVFLKTMQGPWGLLLFAFQEHSREISLEGLPDIPVYSHLRALLPGSLAVGSRGKHPTSQDLRQTGGGERSSHPNLGQPTGGTTTFLQKTKAVPRNHDSSCGWRRSCRLGSLGVFWASLFPGTHPPPPMCSFPV